MSDLALVPLRVSLPDRIEAIDLALLPDCGQSEMVRIDNAIEALKRSLSAIHSERFNPLARRFILSSEGLLLGAIFGSMLCGWIAVWSAILLAVLLGVLTAGAAGLAAESLAERYKPEQRAVLAGEIEKLRAHKRRLESREKLTGLIEQSESLQREAVAFNVALAELGGALGSDKEKARIMANRHKLMQQILKFRSEVLEESEE
ncbi:MAG: hypothetical protein QY323_04190 [Patescibacteria group bacterium]|nr:MAG: hypothetical protein QY323_04190 [Patescibacteria group bacterium]